MAGPVNPFKRPGDPRYPAITTPSPDGSEIISGEALGVSKGSTQVIVTHGPLAEDKRLASFVVVGQTVGLVELIIDGTTILQRRISFDGELVHAFEVHPVVEKDSVISLEVTSDTLGKLTQHDFFGALQLY